MSQPVDSIFPPVAPDQMPYWRLVLRGPAQLCFQSNELTGLFFLAAVLVSSPIAAAYMLVAAIIAPGGPMLLGVRREELTSGFHGLNPCLLAISLTAFFETGWTDFTMWGVLIASAAVTVLLVRVLLAILPIPLLALPFLLVFWTLYALEPYVGVLKPLAEPPVATVAATFEPFSAVARSLGQGAFSPTILSGILFLCGLLISNWRHGVIALLGAIIGTTVSYYYHQVDPALVDLGLYGFNGVLAAVAVYVICGGKLRLAFLAALLATIIIPVVADFGVQSLSAPFVFATWLVLALGWFEDHWFAPPPEESEGKDAKD